MPRRGVSIIEVLISIGVAFIGLVGVMAVIPLALSQVSRGDTADRASRLGQNAIEEFNLREMRHPNNWRWPNTTRASLDPTLPNGVVGNPSRSTSTSNLAFAIDPRFVSRNGTLSSGDFNATTFPYIDRSAYINASVVASSGVALQPRMERISVAAMSGDTTIPAMALLLSDEIFQAQDALGFELLDDETLPPVQNYGTGLKRQSAGELSWMATLAPKLDFSGSFKDLYTLSIVVFRDRDASMTMFEDLDADGAVDTGEPSTGNERVTWILANQFHSGGFGGGDLTMEALTEEDLELRTGDWVMLMRNLRGTALFLKWYRVVEAGDPRLIDRSIPADQYRPGEWEVDVTLLGADWPAPDPSLPGASFPDNVVDKNSQRVAVTWATLVKNVVAVYEKTIRLESTSLWTN